jgi:single-stranded-DNA-specific exonuclease
MTSRPRRPAEDHEQAPVPVRIRRLEQGSQAIGGIADLIRQLYVNRGSHVPSPLELASLETAAALYGIDSAADLLAEAVIDQRPIIVVGDYDADGATGTVVALLGLRRLGAAAVDYLIPSRFADGYGLSPSVVDAAAERGAALILTVDNGIGSVEGVARANALGIPVLITDHHLPGGRLPAAAAIVNPNQPGCAFPSKSLAGVGVVFYLLAATRSRLAQYGWLGSRRPPPKLAELLDLVALGTVADVVTLDTNNRILVEQGLRRIRHGYCRPGLRALLEVAGRRLDRVTATDLGFAAGPRLNAAGRLEDMSVGVECLLCDDPVRASALARQLDGLNRERRGIEHDMRDTAEALVGRQRDADGALPAGLCLFAPDWHQGVIGIVAARVRERWQRPVVAFADGGDGMLKGSARSVEALHIRDVLDLVDRRHPGLINRFGGHAMAAGLSIPTAALAAFRAAFAAEVRNTLGDQPPVREILSDGELPAGLLSLETAEAVRFAGPWGKGFPEPIFDGPFEVQGAKVVAERHLKLRVRAPGGVPLEAIGFGMATQCRQVGESSHLAYRLDVNEYRGLRAPQLLIEHLSPVDCPGGV